MKRFLAQFLVFLFLGLVVSTSVFAETTWITKKKSSKESKIKSLEQMYLDGLLTRSECIKAKKKILKDQSIPGCKKTETEEESTVTYITKKKKSEEKKKKENKLEEQLYKIERLTPGDYYVFAHSTSGEKFWGSTEAKNKTTQVGNATSSNGYTCELISKVTRNKPPYKGSFKLDCSAEVINGSWTQDCNRCNGIGQAFTRSGDVITAFFSKSKSETVEVVKSYFGKSGSTQIAKKEKKETKKKIKKYKPKETEEDTIKPTIEIASTLTFKQPDYVLKGKVTDEGGSEKVYLFIKRIGGKERLIKLKNGKFEVARFSYGEEVEFIARDEYRNETSKIVKITVTEDEEIEIAKAYDKPQPIIKGKKNTKRVAIIIGVESYENTVEALYASNDAETFKNFAHRALGISISNINVLINSEAKRIHAIKALKKWLPQKIIPNQSELFVFFSGHGYPSEDEGLHLIPQNGDPTLLEDTALSHKSIIKLIQKTKPKSVTMFIDACYSGQSNTGEVLVAGLKPLAALEVKEDVPSNFNIFSSSESNQTSGTIKEAKHGIFSYYLMKGLEGKADFNKDSKITNNELFVYLRDNVSQEAFTQNREQNPILNSGNPDQVLMRY